MHKSIKIAVFAFAVLLAGFAAIANALDENAIDEQVANLDWQIGPGQYPLPEADASVTISDGQGLVLGDDATKFFRLGHGHDLEKPDAVVFQAEGSDTFSVVYYLPFLDVGYLELDDWNEFIDKDEIMEVIIANTEKANKAKESGYPKVYNDGWAQDPYLDKLAAVVYWAVNAYDSNGHRYVNAKALKLGRSGFTSIWWIGDPDIFSDVESVLYRALQAYEFDNGARYVDFNPKTDTIAAVGIGALVYKMITGKKAAKGWLAVTVGVIIAFAKKLWFLIFLPFVWFFGWGKRRLFTKKEKYRTEE